MNPPQEPKRRAFQTAGGLRVTRSDESVPHDSVIESLVTALDARRGAVFTSSYEYPGRYTRWDVGFVDPPLEIGARDREVWLRCLNDRGRVVMPWLVDRARTVAAVEGSEEDEVEARFVIRQATDRFAEEERSKQPSVFSLLRAWLELLRSEDDQLGFYGAFGYDLALQFEPLDKRLERPHDQRDLVLYFPDEIVTVDHSAQIAQRSRYDFAVGGESTEGRERRGAAEPYVGAHAVPRPCDHEPGEYAALVRVARESFRRGDLFEVVPGQVFYEPCVAPPSEVFRRLRQRNPAPYGFLIALGEREYLVGASPEMYVRVEGERVETCPISGTIARGADPIDDALRVRQLLNSQKDESELTMCTDVDRNDKSRICEPGSVRVIGRRQIEMYSRLIHTVDHVEGKLRDGFDALDAFLSHTWAVTVTGAPKAWAMRFIEEHEKSARAWYGGAVGWLRFDGSLNTGLTLRTVRIKEGVAEVRAGATLLYDSDPEAEEVETRVKASALRDAILRPRDDSEAQKRQTPPMAGRRVLLVDHQDSFVHTLANYLRQTGAAVTTLRSGFALEELEAPEISLVVLSPGPGWPRDHDTARTLDACQKRQLPVFGVCLGLQGLVEYCGGQLEVLDYPMHGKESMVRVLGGRLFDGLPKEFRAGRYHSLVAERSSLPEVLEVTAETEDGVVMAIEHRELPWAAVQFHPESILTLAGECGMRLIRNVMSKLGARTEVAAAAELER